MQRLNVNARPDYLARLAEAGCNFPTMYGQPYMAETLPQPAAYRLTSREVDAITAATRELHQIGLAVVDHAVHNQEAMELLGIPNGFADLVAASWKRRDPDLYQRLDLCFDRRDRQYKMFEFNGDTPTGVVEMNANLRWWEDAHTMGIIGKDTDVFNDFRYHLTERFSRLKREVIGNHVMHFSSVRENDEEEGTVKFLRACADDAELHTNFLYLDEIRAVDSHDLIDLENARLDYLFKLYPWEDMTVGEFAEDFRDNTTCAIMEPIWKMVWSNKAFLPLAWKLFPNHPNLLPAYMEGDAGCASLKNVIRKPQWGREGQNMQVIVDGKIVHENGGCYGDDAMIIQEHIRMPCYFGKYPIIGSWVVNDQPAGVLIREDSNPITGNLSACVPTFIQ